MDREQGWVDAYASSDIQAAVARALKGRPHDTLLKRAAAGLATVCARELRARFGRVYGRRVVLLVGTGNNGADALLAGVCLQRRGAQVTAVLTGSSAYEPGVERLRAFGGRVVAGMAGETFVTAADLVVDGIVGDRSVGPLTDPARALVQVIPTNAVVVAVDLPSGIDPDTGELSSAYVRADVTVTFGTFKACLLAPPGCVAAGRVEFVDVGFAADLSGEPVLRRMTSVGIARHWPVPGLSDHKYSRGVLGVVAGSDTYPGAAVLACLGAYRAGVGVVRFIGPRRVTDHVLDATPEAVPGAGSVHAWLLGSGVVDDAEQDRAMASALASGLPCVVDAGALSTFARARLAGTATAPADQVLLTPHTGELSRMLVELGHEVTTADVVARPLEHVRMAAREVDATVLLKGHTTLVASPTGLVYSQAEATTWLATAGSGDVLAGIAGALLAGRVEATEAGAMAASVHGMAAERAAAGGPISAGQIADATPATVAGLLAGLTQPR